MIEESLFKESMVEETMLKRAVKKLLLTMGMLAILMPFGVGCETTEPVIWSWPHNKRRIMTINDGFHKLHMSIDRIIFDMPEYPIEPDY